MGLDYRHGISYWRSLLSHLPFSLLFGYHPDVGSARLRVGSFGYSLSFSRDKFLLLSGYDIQPNLDESLHRMGCRQLDWIVAIYCGICWSFIPSVSNSVSLSLELRILAILSSRNETYEAKVRKRGLSALVLFSQTHHSSSSETKQHQCNKELQRCPRWSNKFTVHGWGGYIPNCLGQPSLVTTFDWNALPSNRK